MSKPLFLLIMVAVVALIFLGMWLGWRARARRDRGVLSAADAPSGELLAEFSRILYVSTTPAGEPLARVSAPGLRYRGYADVAVRADGATIQVAGEAPVHIATGQIRGGGSASHRVGKAVEPGGLALLRWAADGRELESSFRFGDAADHERFAAALDRVAGVAGIADSAAGAPAATTAPSQEDEK